MRKIVFTWLLALVAGAAAFASPMNDDGHVLTSLWKQYQDASKADRPQLEADILSQIKEEAIRRHLPVDFYDAATAYVEVVERRDWKQRDQVRAQLEKEVKDFDEPIVTFHWMNAWKRLSTDALWKYVKDHPDGFKGKNPAFYRDVSSYLGGTLKPFIENDREYVLWCVLRGRIYSIPEDDEMYQALKKEVAGKYPNEAALEYYVLRTYHYTDDVRREQHRAALQAMAQKYEGKAVSLYPRADLLSMEKYDLEKAKAPGTSFRELCDRAQELENERLSYTGTEATIAAGCKGPGNMIKDLTESDLEISLENGNILVAFQNLQKAKVTLRSGNKTLKRWNAVNPKGSFYVTDSLTIPFPALPDGYYTFEAVSGELSDEASYSQYTLSVATRNDSNGPSVYVADYETGEPLEKATLYLYKGGKVLAKTTMKLDGFTPYPEAFRKAMAKNNGYLTLVAANGRRKSREVQARETVYPEIYRGGEEDGIRCHIYRDQGAYKPGDTVHFKAVVYEGDPARELRVIAGRKLTVRLRDTQYKEIATQELTTNEYGAVSGSFVLPRGLRNGQFRLDVGGLATSYFRVDEFVLPSFDLSVDELDKLYMVGDEIPVSGSLESYSGHVLSGARISAKVSVYGNVVQELEVPVEADNSFHFRFPAPMSGYYNVELIVTDATGETLEFGSGFYVGDKLSVDAVIEGAADVDLTALGGEGDWYWRRNNPTFTVLSRTLPLTLQALDASGNSVPLAVQYKMLAADESVLFSGESPSGEAFSLELPGVGYYRLVTEVSATKKDGAVIQAKRTFFIYCIPPESSALMPQARRVFIPGPLTVAPDALITARVGTTEGIAYAQAFLYGEDKELLEKRTLQVADGTLADLSFDYKASYPDAVRLQVFYFIHGEAVSYDRQFRRERDRYSMPLQFTRFQDKAYPGTLYSFTLKTAPDAEVLVAAWDKSLDAIAGNYWALAHASDFSVDRVYVESACGSVGKPRGGDGPIIAYGRSRNGAVQEDMLMAEAAPMMAKSAGGVREEAATADEVAGLADVEARSDFASSLTFQPHLRPSADGTLEFSFRTSDKLSTYYVRALAHDKAMRNALVEQEMVVSVPVKVALVEPRFLYEGDVYDAAVTVSSNVDHPVSGVMGLFVGETLQQLPVTVNPGETITHRFRIQADPGEVVLKAVFKASDFTDAVQVTVPVYPAAQELTEAHSAVLHAGESRETLLKQLRSRFVNMPASAAQLKEISVLDMVRDAIPSHVTPSGKDVLSLSEAWYVRLMASKLESSHREGEASISGAKKTADAPEIDASPSTEELLEKILACRNADGGFGWFEGMSSSPAITAVMLERFAKLRARGFQVPDVKSSVSFLDKVQFDSAWPYWRGGISDAQYVYIRSLYADVPFKVKAVSATEKKRMEAFRKWAKDYLTPSAKDGRGLKGQILSKARRLLSLKNLMDRDGGAALCVAWDVPVGATLKQSLQADVLSLVEYAVEHRDGGWYYPNAVMPWRGLMESEAYAHALLCDLLASVGEGDNALSSAKKTADASERALSPSGTAGNVAIADGVRLWLMLQKETQHWDTEPAYIDAITAILDASPAVLDTRVMVLSGSYEAPFKAVKASGNGFKIQRKFYKEETVERLYDDKTGPNDFVTVMKELKPGDPVQVGDKIVAKYLIWNGENRSFVKLTAGREAALQPVQQLSGHLGYGFIAAGRRGVNWGFVPQGYRNVKSSCTEYYFDSYPEENTELAEEFYVQQAGRFVAPVLVIESMYAPHYRANSAFRAPLEVSE